MDRVAAAQRLGLGEIAGRLHEASVDLDVVDRLGDRVQTEVDLPTVW
jgi:hypothetical protein